MGKLIGTLTQLIRQHKGFCPQFIGTVNCFFGSGIKKKYNSENNKDDERLRQTAVKPV
jgi:hypothetical protein